jgi:Uma2 family endonuclease
MTEVRRLHRYVYAEYVALEVTSPTKHEFFDGEIYAMAGGSEEHSALAFETLALVARAVGDRPCRVHTSDLRIYVEAVGLATFPDGSLICGALEQHSASPEATAVNPMILLEVTSNSSERYDTVDKVEFYRTIPSLRDYIIVSHTERRITLLSRGGGGEWSTTTAGPGGRVRIASLEAELAVDDVYRRSQIR